ncbi:MAG TPA: PEP-CTERM sorting domain-containing protein [Kiritimatiellia bacterium]|nr:PEP-CTERM sorting domain-containing protein [Kiritimatiellia bacterium]HRZ12278.1 PEP-CTERM sorting domain-containing protein [Kiritimatiellia bacterium]HSA17964.1 PEP-CTERM sorting domain-containing protein [Kiritimatiellia bacterium]
MRLPLCLMVCLCSLSAAEAAVTNYVETFNDTGDQEHHWMYWGQPTGGGEVADQSVVWMANGGAGGTPRVTVDMENLDYNANGYWLHYLNSPDVGGTRTTDQELNFNDHIVTAAFNSHNIADPFNGGSVFFFLGQYIDGGNSAWYYFNQAFTVNVTQDDWSQATSIGITGAESEWTLLSGNASISVTNLFNNPQQYGFVIVGAGSQPTYNLSMDNFSAAQVIPEPGVLALLGAGLALLHLKRARSPGR